MSGRATNFYFAPLTFTESLRALLSAPLVLALGARPRQSARVRFEREWCARTGALGGIATPSARSGLHAVLAALGIGPGDEVLVTGFTCEAVPEAVLFLGARAVYVDIDARHFAMDPQAAATAITPRTRAIIIQHTFGLPAPLDALIALARSHGLAVVEDCALALGSAAAGRWLGTAGDAAVFSFELSKTLTAGWGGLVQVNRDPALLARLRDIRDGGGVLRRRAASRRLFQAGLSGLLYRPEIARFSEKMLAVLFLLGWFGRSATATQGAAPPSEYLAAPAATHWSLLSRQLRRIDRLLSVRKRTAQRYDSILERHDCGRSAASGLPEVRLIRYPLLVRNRERFAQAFADAHIEAGRWFSSPVACSRGRDMSQYGYQPGMCVVAEHVAAHIVNLPLHERMSERDVEAVAACLDRYLTAHADEREFIAAALK